MGKKISQSRIKVAKTDDLDPGSRVLVGSGEIEIAVFNIDGEYHAVANYCPHASGPLCEGEVSGLMNVGDDGWSLEYDSDKKIINCPWHLWRFDIETGESVEDNYKVPIFDIEIEDDVIYVCR